MDNEQRRRCYGSGIGFGVGFIVINIPKLGRRIKNWLQSDYAYQILDADPEIKGSTWTTGGCGVVAVALQQLLPGSSLYAIFDQGLPQHVVVKFNGYFLDADGASTQKILLQRWQKIERLLSPKLVSISSVPTRSGIPCPISLVKKIKTHLVKEIR